LSDLEDEGKKRPGKKDGKDRLYGYLLKMNIITFSQEKLEKLEAQI
jgi:hypothetical protein